VVTLNLEEKARQITAANTAVLAKAHKLKRGVQGRLATKLLQQGLSADLLHGALASFRTLQVTNQG
jgi:hypothetical protein